MKLAALALALALPVAGQFTQQGLKLVGSPSLAGCYQGTSIAIAGNTLVTGAICDSSVTGAAWTFTRSGTTWIQQAELKDAAATTYAGQSVAISSDGSTILVGGILQSPAGAVWVWTWNGSAWAEQATLTPTGATGAAQFGASVALSSDGNTAAIGGAEDNSSAGAVWVFTRSGTMWTQQGSKLVGSGAGSKFMGYSIALSSDGNTLIAGSSSALLGAGWVFTRSGTTWTEQQKLTGSGSINFGWSVALSSDGNTAAIGAGSDGNGTVRIWTRSGTTWAAGQTLTPSGATTGAFVGSSVALSADGNTLVAGAYNDNSGAGAIWEFTRTAGTFTQVGTKLTPSDGATPNFGISAALSSDALTAIIGGSNNASAVGATWVFVQAAPSVRRRIIVTSE